MALGATSASAALTAPVYPVPGHAGAGHGGNTCQSSTGAEAASGKTGGMTWSFGGGTAADPSPGCTFSATPPALPDFDTTRWERLYWGADASNSTTKMPQLALDGTIDAAGETLSLVPDDGTPGGTDSDLAAGKVVWAGSTTMTWCDPASCGAPSFTTTSVGTRFTLTIKNMADAAVPLVTPAAAGAAEPNAGGLVQITESLKQFKAHLLFEAQNPNAAMAYQPAITMFNSLNHPIDAVAPQTRMSFTGGFRYESRAPTADFTFPAPQNGQAVTFTSTSADPDGTVDGYSWDLDGDNSFGDATTSTASGTYGPGTHTVRLRVTDDDGTQSTAVSKTFTIAAPTQSGGGGSGAGSGGTSGGGAAAVDSVAPAAKAAFAKSKLKTALKKGLKGTLTSNEAGRATLSITLPAKLAKKLKLKGAVGKATVTISAAGKKAFTIKFSKKAARKLRRLKKLSVKVTGKMTDAAGNATNISATVSLK